MISNFRRRYPSLVRRAERDAGMKFKKKPRLVLFKRTPNDTCACGKLWHNGEGKNLEVVKAEICLSKRMVRDYEPLAEVVASHELRENLMMQHGCSKTKSHRLAERLERRDEKKLGLKRAGWELRNYYGRNITRRTQLERLEERTLGHIPFTLPSFRLCVHLAKQGERR